jgi:hypothetical protein
MQIFRPHFQRFRFRFRRVPIHELRSFKAPGLVVRIGDYGFDAEKFSSGGRLHIVLYFSIYTRRDCRMPIDIHRQGIEASGFDKKDFTG